MKRDIEVDEREIARFPGAGIGEGGLRLVALEFCGVITYALEDDTGIFDAHPDLLDAMLEVKAHLEIEDAQIEALEDEASEAGDDVQAKACGAALDGDGDARGMALVSVLRQITDTRREARFQRAVFAISEHGGSGAEALAAAQSDEEAADIEAFCAERARKVGGAA